MGQLNENDFFERMCVWEDNNFPMCGGTGGGEETDSGMVDGHAYTVLRCLNNVGNTDIDLIQIRNPWGHKEVTSSVWSDNGPGWQKHPQIKAICNPTKADDDVFWLTKEEF